MVALKIHVYLQIPRTRESYLFWKQGLCSCNLVKNLELRIILDCEEGPKMQSEASSPETEEKTQGRGVLKMEAYSAVMQPQTKEPDSHGKPGGAGRNLP